MFIKFSKEDISGQTALKSSVQRGIRNKILEQMPLLAAEDGALLESIWPKKEALTLVKCRDHISIFTVAGEPLFFQHFDGPYYPTLRLLQKYPDLLPTVRVDRGAIRFILAGANIMSPGLTSAGGQLPPADAALPAGAPVAVFAEGKEAPVGIGLLKFGTEEIKKTNKGIGIDSVHYLGDGLWGMERI